MEYITAAGKIVFKEILSHQNVKIWPLNLN